jgi:archaellum biogenesis ATPase FlaH
MVEDLVRHLSFAVQILQVSLIEASRGDIAAVGAMTQTLTSKVSALEADFKIRQKDDKYHKVMAWLSAPDSTTNHSAARQKHQEGTGSWLLACDSYLSWKQKSGSHLWINGKAGSGKTVLCSTAIDDLDSYDRNSRDVVVAYFYFSFAEVDKQSFDNLLASLVRQLCNNQPPFKHLEEEYNKQARPSRTLLIETLSIACKQYGEVIIVLDALDELPEGSERQAVLGHLAELKKSATNVKTIVTSRSMPDIGDAVTSYGAVSLPIDLAQVNEDIRLYVASQFRQAPRLQSWRSEMQRRVQETFQSKADVM